MKKSWSILLSLLFVFFLLRLVNDMLEMGERLGRIHPWVEIGFYVFLVFLILWAIAIPVRWMLKAPVRDFGALFKEEEPDAKTLKEIQQALMKNAEEEEKKDLLEAVPSRQGLVDALQLREKEVDDTIVQTSILTFLTTAISPNGVVDIIAVVYYNFRMIGKLVDRFGVRPSFFNILRILRNVFLTAFVVNQLEELEINEYMEEMMESFGDVATGKLLAKTMDSVIQGVLAAFVTLKIGYAAKAVLVDPAQTKEYGFRRSIRRAARKSLVLEVLPKSAGSVPRGFGRMIMMLAGKLKKSQPDLG
ncbi:DUF697 domain-containing protein [Alkalibacter rhizosphaerae]|uniref:DUF697 domain-containing protein n=1 Tax=Alkalibacter rhizosphaerae TaxID=2815577 RepID=A0A974XKB7_9FIRM|nr:DUF697 domain-containing protein [Alkalibacter rhizosphaerae]QSX07546.1 DUF697 domain-containing protein [Alkalibacter rhizosphaerae]